MLVTDMDHKHHSLFELLGALFLWKLIWCLLLLWKIVFGVLRRLPPQEPLSSLSEVHGVFCNEDLPSTSEGKIKGKTMACIFCESLKQPLPIIQKVRSHVRYWILLGGLWPLARLFSSQMSKVPESYFVIFIHGVIFIIEFFLSK